MALQTIVTWPSSFLDFNTLRCIKTIGFHWAQKSEYLPSIKTLLLPVPDRSSSSQKTKGTCLVPLSAAAKMRWFECQDEQRKSCCVTTNLMSDWDLTLFLSFLFRAWKQSIKAPPATFSRHDHQEYETLDSKCSRPYLDTPNKSFASVSADARALHAAVARVRCCHFVLSLWNVFEAAIQKCVN